MLHCLPPIGTRIAGPGRRESAPVSSCELLAGGLVLGQWLSGDGHRMECVKDRTLKFLEGCGTRPGSLIMASCEQSPGVIYGGLQAEPARGHDPHATRIWEPESQ